jgi:hypothetical protein
MGKRSASRVRATRVLPGGAIVPFIAEPDALYRRKRVPFGSVLSNTGEAPGGFGPVRHCVGFAERCPSGRRSAPGERVYPLGIVGSNPTLSAISIVGFTAGVLKSLDGNSRGVCQMNPSVVIKLDAEALMELQAVLIDEDPADALSFVKKRIASQIPKKGTAPCDSTRINPYLLKDQRDT